MMVLITYDVNTQDYEGRTRLRKIAKECLNYGQRVQNSVFECLLTPLDFKILKNKIETIADSKKDSIRYYNLGKNWSKRVVHYGAKLSYNPEEPIIV